MAARDASESPQPVAPEEPDPIDAAIDAELAARKARDALRPVAIDALQVVINVSRSKANRPVIAKAGCVPPVCALLDPAVHPAEITSRPQPIRPPAHPPPGMRRRPERAPCTPDTDILLGEGEKTPAGVNKASPIPLINPTMWPTCEMCGNSKVATNNGRNTIKLIQPY